MRRLPFEWTPGTISAVSKIYGCYFFFEPFQRIAGAVFTARLYWP